MATTTTPASRTEAEPLAQYAGLAALYAIAFGGGLAAARNSGRELPGRLSARDLALLAVATQQLSRLISRDEVTRFLRAPFTKKMQEEDAPPGEMTERPRSDGAARRAIGQLLSCTLCVDQWTAAGLLLGFVAAPRTTRTIASVFVVKGVADVLHVAYARFATPQ